MNLEISPVARSASPAGERRAIKSPVYGAAPGQPGLCGRLWHPLRWAAEHRFAAWGRFVVGRLQKGGRKY